MKTRNLRIVTLLLIFALLVPVLSVNAEEAQVGFSSLADFAGKNICYVSGTTLDSILEHTIGEVQNHYYDDVSANVLALEHGDADAFCIDAPIAQMLMMSHPQLAIFPELVANDQYGFVLQKGSSYTAEFSAIIQEFWDDGTIDSLREKWLSGDDARMLIDYSLYDLEKPGRDTLTCYTGSSNAPFYFIGGEANQPQGYEVELLYMIADRLDMGVRIVNGTFSGLISAVVTGKANVGLGGISITEERRESVDFPPTHYIGGIALVCKKDAITVPAATYKLDSPLMTLLAANDAAEAAARSAYPRATVRQVNDLAEMLPLLSSGEAQILLLNEADYETYVAKNHNTLTLHESSPLTDGIAIAVLHPDYIGVSEGELSFLEDLALRFEKTFVRENRWQLVLRGLGITIQISVLSGILGTVLGFVLYFAKNSKHRPLALFFQGLSRLVAGIPSLVILMIVYFIIFRSSGLPAVFIGTLAFAFMFSFSVAGLLATGIGAVDAGQAEAAATLGFHKTTTFVRIVLPQAVRHVLPLYKTQLIALVHATSVVGYIAIEDLTKAGDIIRSRTYDAFFPLIATALIYFAISILITKVVGRLELTIDPAHRARKLPKGVVNREHPSFREDVRAAQGGEELIRISNLEKDFGSVKPLNGVNAVIRRGDIISIIGPSGTGKSTLLRCINRLEQPTAGSIVIFGEDICDRKTDLTAVRRRMGMVFQSFNLFGHMTVLENIMLAPTLLNKEPVQAAYENAMQLLHAVGMAEKVLAYPAELSGGQKQRVAIARTLAMRPDIVMLDEPTSALDPTMVVEVLEVIKRLAAEGLTMMIVTHEMRFAQEVSTRMFYMDEGTIYEEGTPDEIFNHPKRERTARFVGQLKNLTLEIDTPDFDFIALNRDIYHFSLRYSLTKRQLICLQHAFEELCEMGILPGQDGVTRLTVTVSYRETGGGLTMDFVWDGSARNPFADTEALPIRVIRAFIQDVAYRYEGDKNRLRLFL